jgi:hypothetical protein
MQFTLAQSPELNLGIVDKHVSKPSTVKFLEALLDLVPDVARVEGMHIYQLVLCQHARPKKASLLFLIGKKADLRAES